MNKEEAVAYSIMALKTLQNSANGDNKLKDIKAVDFEEEMRIMFRLYKRSEVLKIANSTNK